MKSSILRLSLALRYTVCVLAFLTSITMSALAADVAKSVKADPHVKDKISKDISGVYSLVSVDGKPVPTRVSHEGASLQITSGTFTIEADGSCTSKMTFTPPGATKSSTRETKATSTREGKTLRMQWTGAGTTTGKIKGDTFTMQNEDMTFIYRRQIKAAQN